MMPFLDLLQRVCIVVGGDGHITAVDYLCPGVEGVGGQSYIVAAIQIQSSRTLPNTRRWSRLDRW